jgi:hypothetical protein
VSPHSRQIRWFGGLYLASIVALALVASMVRLVLWLVAPMIE